MAADVEKSQKHKLMHLSEISLMLDTYDDIFSDFDPRPFSQRSLSVDFLDEIKRASRDKVSGEIELRFLIPQNLRDNKLEDQINKRLKDHFKRHYAMLEKETKKTISQGISIAALGFAFMFLGILINYRVSAELTRIILTTLLEPSGWFMMFFGFDTAFYGMRQKQPEVEFYKKMSKAEITFVSY